MTTTQITPLPWIIRPDHPAWKSYHEFRNDIVKSDGSLLATCYPANDEAAGHAEANANAAFIVDAVNSITPLREQNKLLVEALAYYANPSTYDIIDSYDSVTGVSHRAKPITLDGGDRARAALKRVEA